MYFHKQWGAGWMRCLRDHIAHVREGEREGELAWGHLGFSWGRLPKRIIGRASIYSRAEIGFIPIKGATIRDPRGDAMESLMKASLKRQNQQ